MTGPAPDQLTDQNAPVYTRVDLVLTATVTDKIIILNGTPVGAVLVAQWPAGVTLELSFGGKEYIPIPSPEGRTLAFEACEVELKGVRLRTTGVAATAGVLIFFASPVFTS